jgi:hypothetical protein
MLCMYEGFACLLVNKLLFVKIKKNIKINLRKASNLSVSLPPNTTTMVIHYKCGYLGEYMFCLTNWWSIVTMSMAEVDLIISSTVAHVLI